MPTTAFTDLDRAVDRLHAVCDGWTDEGPIAHVLGADGMHVLRLTLHEWVANLVQHASFAAEAEILLTIDVQEGAVHCIVEDTSAGFDFAAQIESQRTLLDAPGPSERAPPPAPPEERRSRSPGVSLSAGVGRQGRAGRGGAVYGSTIRGVDGRSLSWTLSRHPPRVFFSARSVPFFSPSRPF